MEQIINLIFRSTFSGFAFYSILKSIINKLFQKENKIFNDEIDNSAIFIVRHFGLFFLLLLTINILNWFLNPDPEMGHYPLLNHLFGKYWFGFWIYPFAFTFLTQLLWIKPLKKSAAFRLFTALVIIVALSLEKVIIILTSLHRDYLQSSWEDSTTSYIIGATINFVISFLIFAMVVGICNLIRIKWSKR